MKTPLMVDRRVPEITVKKRIVSHRDAVLRLFASWTVQKNEAVRY